MSLTENQLKAISFYKGNALINAGAGSGKSTVLIARTAKLISEYKVNPRKILGLTFTNEAAENMRKKLKTHIGKKQSDLVSFSTFHSFAYRWLRKQFPGEYINKKIMESWWKIQTLYDIVGENTTRNPVGLDINIKAGDLAGFISYQKANLVREGMEIVYDDNVSYVQDIDTYYLQKAYDTYCELVRNARVIDFDDMLMEFYYKLLENPSMLEDVKKQFKFIMVDEFQDSNSAMMAILKLISEDNLFVVGDFRQGIYGFINATIDNILDFQNNFDNVTLIELCDNFRSTNEIVRISNDLISKSPVEQYKSFSEQIASKGDRNTKVILKAYQDENIESESILNEIQSLMDENGDYDYSDFCILCRTNAQLGIYESLFASAEIPVDISTSKSFFDRKEISDILAYASIINNEHDDMSLRKIINSPTRYISKAIINSLEEYGFKNNVTLEYSMRTMDSGNSRSRIMNLIDTIDDLRHHAHDTNASKMLKMIVKRTNYYEFMTQKAQTHTELIIRQEALEKLYEMSKKFSNINSFLGHVSIIKNNNKKKKDAVHLMTVHASKGLEFQTVFVPSVTNENYPHQMNTNSEEERRILYVALSRAIKNLYVSFPVFTNNGTSILEPSPFILDVAAEKINGMKKEITYGKTEVISTY
ncbi:ATP-dependent helicase [Enterococcus sp. N249-2]